MNYQKTDKTFIVPLIHVNAVKLKLVTEKTKLNKNVILTTK